MCRISFFLYNGWLGVLTIGNEHTEMGDNGLIVTLFHFVEQALHLLSTLQFDLTGRFETLDELEWLGPLVVLAAERAQVDKLVAWHQEDCSDEDHLVGNVWMACKGISGLVWSTNAMSRTYPTRS